MITQGTAGRESRAAYPGSGYTGADGQDAAALPEQFAAQVTR